MGLNNFSGTKLDQFLDLDASAVGGKNSKGSDFTLQVHVKNNAPTGEPTYVVGPYPGSGNVEGEYRGQLAVSMPGSRARSPSRERHRSRCREPTAPPRSTRPIDLHRGDERDVTIHFHLPSGVNDHHRRALGPGAGDPLALPGPDLGRHGGPLDHLVRPLGSSGPSGPRSRPGRHSEHPGSTEGAREASDGPTGRL